jgi:multidrug efflux pump subunit AcrB
VDRRAASLRRVPVDRIYRVVATAIGGQEAGLVHFPDEREPVPMVIRLPEKARANLDATMNLTVIATDGSFVPLRELVKVVDETEAQTIYHKDLKRVVYVIGDLAGREESPIYALFAMNKRIDALAAPGGGPVARRSIAAPEVTDRYGMKWDGEWQISYEVFRDMGIAFAVVMVLIYILVVGWFESYLVPIVIMIPIPLSLIGIIPGHWLFGAFFTATSMIGFIAGAGIIVRNSIILVDFIELRLSQGVPLREAVIDAGAVRFRPMLLTAAAVVVGSFVILFDPIFQGLALSLMMGEVAATLLSRFAVPLLYHRMAGKRRECDLCPVHPEHI